tara:strand:+ start:1633 stop:1932 length:300 start_codon:yes stop_codon:yes gene_type:complete
MKKLLLILTFLLSFSIPAFAAQLGGTVYADVNGLVCDFCARALEKVFSKQEAVKSIHVDLDKKVVKIQFNKGKSLKNETITQLITDAGYKVRELRHGQS